MRVYGSTGAGTFLRLAGSRHAHAPDHHFAATAEKAQTREAGCRARRHGFAGRGAHPSGRTP